MPILDSRLMAAERSLVDVLDTFNFWGGLGAGKRWSLRQVGVLVLLKIEGGLFRNGRKSSPKRQCLARGRPGGFPVVWVGVNGKKTNKNTHRHTLRYGLCASILICDSLLLSDLMDVSFIDPKPCCICSSGVTTRGCRTITGRWWTIFRKPRSASYAAALLQADAVASSEVRHTNHLALKPSQHVVTSRCECLGPHKPST